MLAFDVTNKLWSLIDRVKETPASERLNALEAACRLIAPLVGPELGVVDAVDRLYQAAVANGWVAEFGDDRIQEVLSVGFGAAPAQDRCEPTSDDASRPPIFSDEALAQTFGDLHATSLRYVAKLGSWYEWNGVVWKPDETLHVFDRSRRVCRSTAARCSKPKMAVSIASAKTVAAVERLARSDRRIAARVDQWDVDPMLLCTPGGTVDLRSGKIQAPCAHNYITKVTGVTPDYSLSTPKWLQFLDCVTGGDRDLSDFLQRMSGYVLTGLTSEHALFFIYGTGANGKSTFLNALIGCMGDYHRTSPIETFTASATERHPTELAGLRGARLVTAIETEEGRRWAESKIKSLTGGDRIAARFMRQDFFEFTPTFKLVVAGNHRPSLRTVDEAIRRRLHFIPFTVTVPPEQRDDSLSDHLKEEWSGILAWMIRGALAWQEMGLSPPECVRIATAEYLEGEDTLAAWIDDQCEISPNTFESTTALFGSFKVWAERTGEHYGNLKRFRQRLDGRADGLGLRPARNSRGQRGFYGLRILKGDLVGAAAEPA